MIYDYNSECDDPKINKDLFYKVGLGKKVDSNGDVYGVRLYYSFQKSIFEILNFEILKKLN